MSSPTDNENDRPTPPKGAETFWRQYGKAGSAPGADAGAGGSGAGPGASAGGAAAGAGPRAGEPRGRGGHHQRDGHQCLEWCPICRGAELLEASIPPELQEQFRTVQRDVLLLAQSMIAGHLARMQDAARSTGPGGGRGGAESSRRQAPGDPPDEPPVEDIPID